MTLYCPPPPPKKKIASRVNSATCFSILADKTINITPNEQFLLCAHYADESKVNVLEQYLWLVSVSNISDEKLDFTLVESSKSFVTSLTHLRVQNTIVQHQRAGRSKARNTL